MKWLSQEEWSAHTKTSSHNREVAVHSRTETSTSRQLVKTSLATITSPRAFTMKAHTHSLYTHTHTHHTHAHTLQPHTVFLAHTPIHMDTHTLSLSPHTHRCQSNFSHYQGYYCYTRKPKKISSFLIGSVFTTQSSWAFEKAQRKEGRRFDTYQGLCCRDKQLYSCEIAANKQQTELNSLGLEAQTFPGY